MWPQMTQRWIDANLNSSNHCLFSFSFIHKNKINPSFELILTNELQTKQAEVSDGANEP